MKGNRWFRLPFVILVPALVVLALAACGGGDESTPAPATASPTSTGGAGTPGTTPRAIQGLQPGEDLKIGVITTQSGAIGAIGSSQVTGIQIALDEINAAGGVAGHKIQLVIRDDGGDPTRALTAARELVEGSGVKMIFGTTISSPGLAISPYLAEKKVFNIGSYSLDAGFDVAKYPYAFTGSPLGAVQGQAQVKLAVSLLKPKKPAVIAESSAYGDSALAGYQAALKENGFPSADVQRYAQGASDVTPQLQALRSSGADVVFMGSLAADTIRIIRTRNSLGWDVPVFSNSDLLNQDVLDQVGGVAAAKNAFAYQLKNLTFPKGGQPLPKTQAFIDNLKKKLGENPLKSRMQQPGLAYDALYIMKTAIEKAGSVDGAALKTAMESLSYSGAYLDWSFTPQRHSAAPLESLVMCGLETLKEGLCERIG